MRILAWPAFKAGAQNPYNRLLYRAMVESSRKLNVEDFSLKTFWSGPFDVWHIHWPQRHSAQRSLVKAFASTAVLALLVVAARLRRIKVVWTIHNLRAHDQPHPKLECAFMRWFVRRIDGVVALSAGGLAQARRQFPMLERTSSAVIPHGHYVGTYPNAIAPHEARKMLGLEADVTVLLFAGRIHGYKNVPALIGAFRDVSDPDVVLVIAGPPMTPALRREIEAAADGDPRVRVHLEDVPDDRLQVYLNAADAVVYPYRDVLNSSSALLALSFFRPVLVPHVGALPELQARLGEAWVRTYRGDIDTADLRCVRDEPTPADRARLDEAFGSDLGWHDIAQQTLSFFEAVCAEAAA